MMSTIVTECQYAKKLHTIGLHLNSKMLWRITQKCHIYEMEKNYWDKKRALENAAEDHMLEDKSVIQEVYV